MQTVGIKALKNNLSAYIRAAEAGETVLVTDRGKIVAEIVPARAHGDASTPERKWADLIRQGHVTAAKSRLKGPPPRVPSMSFEVLMKEIDADRDDR